MKIKTPWLKKIDLRKIIRDGDTIGHPDINTKSWYLIKFGKDYVVGNFFKEWYGLYFSDSYIDFCLDDDHIKGIWQIQIR